MIIITSTDTHMTFSDGGDFSLTVPKEQITLRYKGDYVYFSFIAWSGEPRSITQPKSLRYLYSDVTNPSTVSGSDLYDALSAMLAGAAPQKFTATAGQTTFTVTDFTASSSSLMFVNGALTLSGWTLSGQDFVFTVAPGIGATIVIVQ